MERKTFLNRYRLCVDPIGIPVVIRRSADEATLQADDLVSGRQVALQLEPAAAFGPAEREQIAAEARSAQQLNHINIPVLRDFGFDNDQLFYVTEFFEGTTAEDWIKMKGPMPASAVLRIAAQVASALGAASAHGIIHYAVHPGNIILVPGETAEGEWPLIKVLNLVGVAPPLPPPGTNGSALLNPADFASPEQLKDGEVDFRSEIYSLGCTLWFLLKGHPPVGGAAVLQNNGGLFAPVRRLLADMLAENPGARPRDPVAFQGQIQDCLAEIERQDVVASAASEIPAPAIKSEPLPQRRSAWKPLELAAILVAIATLAAIVWTQRKQQQSVAEVATPMPEILAVPLVTDLGKAETSPTEEVQEPRFVTSSSDGAEEKTEQSVADNAIANAAESPAAVAPISTSNIAMMLSAPPDRESIEQPAPVNREISSAATTGGEANVLPDQESAEQPAPVFASNSSSRDLEIPPIEAAPQELPTPTEALPPAEGPGDIEKIILEISSAMSLPTSQAETGIPITSPQIVPGKISKPATVTKPSTKKSAAALLSRPPVGRNLLRPSYPVIMVGHIFPVSPDARFYEAPPAPPSKPVVRSVPHRRYPGASVGHVFYPVSPSHFPHEERRRPHHSVRAPEKKHPVASVVPSA